MLRPLPFVDQTAILPQGAIFDVMEAVLDLPVAFVLPLTSPHTENAYALSNLHHFVAAAICSMRYSDTTSRSFARRERRVLLCTLVALSH